MRLELPAQEVLTSQDYSNRPIHTVAFHYNNCIYPKGKFIHHDAANQGWEMKRKM
ncbi:MAG: hypothetical protein LBU51_04755 [Bacteroidales bacterium]|nr:hypothetical protein [Bacteroidales bacterium]